MKKNYKLIGYYSLSNSASINIYEIDDETVKWSYNNRKVNTSKIRWAAEPYLEGTPYFMAMGKKVFIHNCMTVASYYA